MDPNVTLVLLLLAIFALVAVAALYGGSKITSFAVVLGRYRKRQAEADSTDGVANGGSSSV